MVPCVQTLLLFWLPSLLIYGKIATLKLPFLLPTTTSDISVSPAVCKTRWSSFVTLLISVFYGCPWDVAPWMFLSFILSTVVAFRIRQAWSHVTATPHVPILLSSILYEIFLLLQGTTLSWLFRLWGRFSPCFADFFHCLCPYCPATGAFVPSMLLSVFSVFFFNWLITTKLQASAAMEHC